MVSCTHISCVCVVSRQVVACLSLVSLLARLSLQEGYV